MWFHNICVGILSFLSGVIILPSNVLIILPEYNTLKIYQFFGKYPQHLCNKILETSRRNLLLCQICEFWKFSEIFWNFGKILENIRVLWNFSSGFCLYLILEKFLDHSLLMLTNCLGSKGRSESSNLDQVEADPLHLNRKLYSQFLNLDSKTWL